MLDFLKNLFGEHNTETQQDPVLLFTEPDCKPTILYICNRKKCENCSPECRHVSDIHYAANFDYDPTFNVFYEKGKSENEEDN